MEREKKDYWRWSESKWVNPNIPDWHESLVTAGVDIGSTSTQAVIMADDEIYAYASIRTGNNSPDSAVEAVSLALEGTDMTPEDFRYCVGTGYGRVNVPFANKTITEISCHAMGGHFMYGPSLRTLLDMGGQDCKAIHVDQNGRVTSFAMNDKCAAGTGRGMEVIANLLAVQVEDIGPMSLNIDGPAPEMNSTCVVYAKSEAIDLMRQGWTKEMVLAGYCRAMAQRVSSLLKRSGLEPEFAITGGIAKNIGVVKRIEEFIGMKALTTNWDTQLAGAIGAAILAKRRYEKKSKR